MKRLSAPSYRLRILSGLLLLNAQLLMAEPMPTATAAFDAYAHVVEARLAEQHRSAQSFVTAPAVPDAERRLRAGELIVERLTPVPNLGLSGALLHHWRATAFAPNATPADFERLMRDVNAYPQHFSPQVLQARILTQSGNNLQALMRVRQHHVLTVVMDTTYDITFGQRDPQHGYSLSRSTHIDEIDAPGSPRTRPQPRRRTRLPLAPEHLLEL